MFERRVYLYAIDKTTGELLQYQYFTGDYINIQNIRCFGYAMKQAHGEDADVWAIDGTRQLAECARLLFKRHLLEDTVAFKDYVTRYGLKIE